MKLVLALSVFGAVLASAADDPVRVADVTKIERAQRVIVLGWDYELKNRTPTKLKTSFQEPEQIKDLLASFSKVPTQESGLPISAGELCHLVFLGEKDELLAYVFVNTLGAFCELRAAKLDKAGGTVPDYDSEAVYFYAPQLGDLLIKELSKHDSEYYSGLKNSHRVNFGITLEESLFGKDKADKTQK